MYEIEFSNRYKKSYKLAIKRGLDVNLLNDVFVLAHILLLNISNPQDRSAPGV